MLVFLIFFIVVTVAYLVGSLCSAVIICRLFTLPDPRTTGSKNPGATNVLRIAGKKYGLMVLIADMLKGLLPVLFAKLLGAGSTTLAFTCLAAVLGHIYPVFFEFQGGKGVATAIGALIGFKFVMGAVIIGTWLLIAYLSSYASLASILAILFAPFYSIFIVKNLDAFYPLLGIALIIIYQHRTNISRLISGDEPKLNLKKISDDISKEA